MEEIGERAFAESGLTKINLPSSLSEDSIADNAIDPGVEVVAEQGTEAYDWAVDNGFISRYPESPLEWFSFYSYAEFSILRQYVGDENNTEDIVI